MMPTPERIERYFRDNPDRAPAALRPEPEPESVVVEPDSSSNEQTAQEKEPEPTSQRARLFQGIRAFIGVA